MVTGDSTRAPRQPAGQPAHRYATAAVCADVVLLAGLGIHGLAAGQPASLALASTVLSVVCGLLALFRGRLRPRYASSICGAAVLSSGAYQLSVRDAAMALAIAGWMALILIFLAPALSRTASAGYAVLAAGSSALAITVAPMPPGLHPLRAAITVSTVLLPAALVPLLHRDAGRHCPPRPARQARTGVRHS